MVLHLLDIDGFKNTIVCYKNVENEVVIDGGQHWREGASEHVNFIKHFSCETEQKVKNNWIEWLDNILENGRQWDTNLHVSQEMIIPAYWIGKNVQKNLIAVLMTQKAHEMLNIKRGLNFS